MKGRRPQRELTKGAGAALGLSLGLMALGVASTTPSLIIVGAVCDALAVVMSLVAVCWPNLPAGHRKAAGWVLFVSSLLPFGAFLLFWATWGNGWS